MSAFDPQRSSAGSKSRSATVSYRPGDALLLLGQTDRPGRQTAAVVFRASDPGGSHDGSPEVRQPASVGVLVVHGIGAQERGETLAKLWNGLRLVFPQMPKKPAEGEPVALAARSVRFYEVYWADLLMGKQVSGTFDFDEFSSLAWFPLFNQIYEAYAKEPYPLWTVFRFSLVLPLAGFALTVVYWGARLFAQLWGAVQERRGGSPEPSEIAGKTLIQRAKFLAERTAHERTLVDKLLDEYAADVFNYINSAGDTFRSDRNVPEHLRHVYREIIGRFYDRLLRARNDGCQSIQIVAHSLGTVVMYHALRGLRLDEAARPDRTALSEAMASIEHLYTIGSPLEKIRFFWPGLRPETNLADERPIAWDNFVSYFDPVAGILRRFNEWGPVNNHRLLGGGFLSGHVVYERSDVFLGRLTEGLLGQAMTPRRTGGQKLKDMAMLLGESLLAPSALFVLLASGAALWIMSAALLPFLVSLPFRLFVGPEIWGPILDYGALLFGGMMLFTFLVVPVIHAKETFGRLHPRSPD